MVFKIIPSTNGTYTKQLVNLYAMEGMHFRDQARIVKKALIDYEADKLVIDANGLGVGILDFLVIPTIAEPNMEEGDPNAYYLAPLGVDKDSDPNQTYKKYYKPDNNQIFFIKATAALNSEMHKLVNTQMASGKIQFLIHENVAKAKLLNTREGKDMSSEARALYLRPFALTSLLRDEMMNLRRQNDDSAEVNLKKINNASKKDKFSAFEYGLIYIRQLELKKKKEGFSVVDLQLTTPNSARGGRTNGLTRFREQRRTGGFNRGTSKQRRN